MHFVRFEQGLFTKEIDEALLDGRIDIAVHSMKVRCFPLAAIAEDVRQGLRFCTCPDMAEALAVCGPCTQGVMAALTVHTSDPHSVGNLSQPAVITPTF